MSKIIERLFKISILVCFSTFMSFSCTETSEAEKLRQYYAAINADGISSSAVAGGPGVSALPGAPTVPGTVASLPSLGGSAPGTSIIGGTPRLVKEGFCGDGIINGPNEDCDLGAIQNTTCSEYGGISGTVKCQQNCLYDISDCITPAVDKLLGGAAETCNCSCSTSLCKGGCMSTNLVGQSACRFVCDNGCDCLCEGKLQAKVERCESRCACIIDASNNPQCECNLDDCQILATIAPNIGAIATTRNRH